LTKDLPVKIAFTLYFNHASHHIQAKAVEADIFFDVTMANSHRAILSHHFTKEDILFFALKCASLGNQGKLEQLTYRLSHQRLAA
jgi:hypothetical protein